MGNQKDINELKIFRNGIQAGILKRTKQGCKFEFYKDFLNQKTYKGISFNMSKNSGALQNNGVNLFPFFAGLLPEGLRLKSLVKNLKTSEDDLFSVFAAIGKQVIGDVYVEADKPFQANIGAKLKEINFYEYFQEIVSGRKIFNDESLAGVQEKISASMISFPVNIAKKDSMYILKLNPNDKPYLVENEFYSMELAKKCGIETAKTKLVKDRDGNNGLLVSRFDRTWNETESVFLMHHQEDACQLLDKYPAEKYRISFNEIVQGIVKHVSASKVAILRLLQLYAFSYLIGNGDLHAKNISLLVKSGSQIIEVSPAYDIICTYIYGDFKMAIKLDGRNDNLKRKTFLDFGERFGVSQVSCGKMLDKLILRFSKHCKILNKITMSEKQRILLNRVIEKRITDLS